MTETYKSERLALLGKYLVLLLEDKSEEEKEIDPLDILKWVAKDIGEIGEILTKNDDKN